MEDKILESLIEVKDKYECAGEHAVRVGLEFQTSGEIARALARIFNIGDLAGVSTQEMARILIGAGVEHIERAMGFTNIAEEMLPKELLKALGYVSKGTNTLDGYLKMYSALAKFSGKPNKDREEL